MENSLIGRSKEIDILQEALKSAEGEMVAVLGRRRVGKTFLITQTFASNIVFELSGIQGASINKQLKNFRDELRNVTGSAFNFEIPGDWLEAFQMLRQYVLTLGKKGKNILFFDEVPWLAGHKSGFLEALGYFWNSWASRQTNIIVVICGSAASWMIRRIVHDKGGLHNRITRLIHLKPFNLAETEAFLHARGVQYDRFQILHLYMTLGGIPHYLKGVKAAESAMQNIERLCFAENAPLRDEFLKLYPALFSQPDRHIGIIKALASKWKGMSRTEILGYLKQGSGGGMSIQLEELEQSGFITSYHPFGKKQKDKIYRLTDSYSLFYLHFIENNTDEGAGAWLSIGQSQRYKSWCGYAFENICLRHVAQIKKAMGISGVYAKPSTFYKKGNSEEEGAEIDLILERNDLIINLFELKFYQDSFIPDKNFADALQQKKQVFRRATETKKHLSWVLLSAMGGKHNQYSIGLVDHLLDLSALFEEI